MFYQELVLVMRQSCVSHGSLVALLGELVPLLGVFVSWACGFLVALCIRSCLEYLLVVPCGFLVVFVQSFLSGVLAFCVVWLPCCLVQSFLSGVLVFVSYLRLLGLRWV